jgi:hypothetical protein
MGSNLYLLLDFVRMSKCVIETCLSLDLIIFAMHTTTLSLESDARYHSSEIHLFIGHKLGGYPSLGHNVGHYQCFKVSSVSWNTLIRVWAHKQQRNDLILLAKMYQLDVALLLSLLVRLI